MYTRLMEVKELWKRFLEDIGMKERIEQHRRTSTGVCGYRVLRNRFPTEVSLGERLDEIRKTPRPFLM